MTIAPGQDWGPEHTRQPCPCAHIRAGEVKNDGSGKCPYCKQTNRSNST